MKQMISKEVIFDEIKSIKNIIIACFCLLLGVFIVFLIGTHNIWVAALSACLLIVAPLVILFLLIREKNREIHIFEKNDFFIVKQSVTEIKHVGNDVTDSGTVYPNYSYKFGEYGSIILEEGTHIPWNNSETQYFLLIWGEKKVIKRVFPCGKWEINDNQFEKEENIYRLKK